MSEEKEVKAKKQSVADMEEEIKRLELEAKRLEVEEKKANLQDLKERLEEREVKRENKKMTSLTNGATLKQNAANEKAAQVRCNHRKGGDGQRAVVEGKGTDPQFAVLKHTFLNGDTWVRCLRCGKTWKPPVEENFYYDEQGQQVHPSSDQFGRLIKPTRGAFSLEKYTAALVEYQTALNFETRNSPSSSYQFRFSDNGKMFRHVMNSATLR